MLRRFTEDDGYCVFFIIRLSRSIIITLVLWTKSKKRDGFIKQEGSKKQRSPLLSQKKKALFVCVFCRFLSKNEKKCRQKSVEEFVHETRTKKTRASNRRRRRRRENERKRVFFSPVVFASSFFFLLLFFSERAR